MLDRIQWLGYSGFRLQGPPLLYLNPRSTGDNVFLADAVLLSDADYEHCLPGEVQKLCGPETQIIGNADAAACFDGPNVQVLLPWQSVSIGRARITAVPTEPAGIDAGALPLGFLLSLGFYDVYYTSTITPPPQALTLRPDILIMPVGESGLLALDAMVETVRALSPRWVIPSHWNSSTGGGYLNVRAFQAAVEGLADVVVPAQTA